MAKLKLAYGCKSNITSAIESSKIPPGTLILTEDTNELYFYNLDGEVKAYQEKYKFSSKKEAEEWVSTYDCKGSIFSVHENEECQVYVVDYNNQLVRFETNATSFEQIQADWNETNPDSPAFIKNKPDIVSGNDRHYVHTQMSPSSEWDITHNLMKYPSVSVVDSAGNLVVGEVTHLSANRLILTFSGAFSGTCYCN